MIEIYIRTPIRNTITKIIKKIPKKNRSVLKMSDFGSSVIMIYSKSQTKFQNTKSKDVESAPARSIRNRRQTQFSSLKKSLQSLSMAGKPHSFKPKELKHCLSSSEALQKYHEFLTVHERKEILSYPVVYFVGINSKKLGLDMISEKDHIAYRYEMLTKIGEGSFSHVWAAIDHKDSAKVAIKVFKNMEQFRGHSLREIEILDGLARTYKTHNKSVEITDNFTFRGQRFLVYPLLSCTLHDKKSLGVGEIMKIASELLEAISQFHKKGIIHCDLKPDNIMFTEEDRLKVIDFGSACSERQKIYFYIQSRFYRAPEVILGYPYDTAIDMWSFGCILAEMVTGYPIFVGKNEGEQLLSIMEFKGYPPNHMIQKSRKREELTQFLHRNLQDNNNLKKIPASRQLSDLLSCDQVYSLIDACLEWDPKKRITAAQALLLPLFKRGLRTEKRRATARHIGYKRKIADMY